jgi:hypothetical protein
MTPPSTHGKFSKEVRLNQETPRLVLGTTRSLVPEVTKLLQISPSFKLKGGYYMVAAVATFGGGSVELQGLS